MQLGSSGYRGADERTDPSRLLRSVPDTGLTPVIRGGFGLAPNPHADSSPSQDIARAESVEGDLVLFQESLMLPTRVGQLGWMA